MSHRNARMAHATRLLMSLNRSSCIIARSCSLVGLGVAFSCTALHAQEQEPTATKNRDPLVLPALKVPNTSIPTDGTNSVPEDLVVGRLPSAIYLPYGPDRYGFWRLETKTWIAPVFCHQPLFFEDTMLERHGQERNPCLQPLLSGARFFSDVAFQPYQAYLHPPLQEQPSAGHYRTGSAAPCLRQRVPYDAGAIRFQLLTTGTVVLAAQP